MLKTEKISKKFKKRIILDEVDINVKKGEIVGILGPNGVGKTTLLNIIMGFVKEDAGEIYINDELLNNLPVHKRVRKGLSYLTQDISVIEDLTVGKNIIAILQLLRKSKQEIISITNRYLEEFDLKPMEKQKAGTLSGGERRKLEIILSLLTDPDIMLFDEPFTGLDPKTIKELHKMILVLKSRDIGIIIVDHNYTEVMNKADRIYLLNNGKVAFNGDPDQFRKDPVVKEVYLG